MIVRAGLLVGLLAGLALTTTEGAEGQVLPSAPRSSLSKPTVADIVQDGDGFIWFATREGLVRFNGHSFSARGAHDLSKVGDYWVERLAAGSDGSLWVGTNSRGVGILRRGQNTVEPMGRPVPGESGPDIQVRDLAAVGASAVVAATSRGAWLYQERDGRVEARELLPDTSARSVAWEPTRGHLWVASDEGQMRRLIAPDWTPDLSISTGLAIRSILPRSSGGALVGTQSQGLYVIDDSGGVEPHPLNSAYFAETSGASVADILEDRGGVIWLASWAGLFRLEEGGLQRMTLAGRDTGSPLTQSLALDGTNTLWVGTFQGWYTLSPQRDAIRAKHVAVSSLGSEPRGIASVSRSPRGLLALGLDGGGVVEVDPSWSTAIWRVDRPVIEGSSMTLALDTDALGGLWVGTHQEGLSRYVSTPLGYRAIEVQTADLGETAIALMAGNRVRWVGTRERGLWQVEHTEGQWQLRPAPIEPPEPYVWALRPGSGGVVWFAMSGAEGGVGRYDPDRDSVAYYSLHLDEGDTPAGRVLDIWPTDSVVWAGTEGGGLRALDVGTGAVTALTSEHGLPNDFVNGILPDDAGYLWLATNDGLARFHPETQGFRTFQSATGPLDQSHSSTATYKDDVTGLLYFGGSGGLTIVDPSKVAPRAPPPPVALTGFWVHGEWRSEVTHHTAADGIVLEPRDNFFTFEFAALDYTDPSLNRYRYRLDPLNDDWNEPSASNQAIYTSVPHGEYTLRVAGRNADGVWNEEGLAIPVTVLTPFHLTRPFQFSVLLLSALLLYAVYRYRVGELMRIERLRFRIAGRLHDDIGANLSAIAMKAAMLKGATGLDEARQRQLNDVARIARKTALALREMVWVVNTQHDTLAGLVKHLRDTADGVLDGVVPHVFKASIQDSDPSVGMELRQNVHLLFKEALHNVLKHAEASEVRIFVDYVKPRLRIRIEDDGVGFDPESPPDGNGLGLMRRRADEIGADLKIDSRSGVGTTVELTVRIR